MSEIITILINGLVRLIKCVFEFLAKFRKHYEFVILKLFDLSRFFDLLLNHLAKLS